MNKLKGIPKTRSHINNIIKTKNSKEWKDTIGKIMRKKLSDKQKEAYKNGRVNPMKGKKRPDLSERNKERKNKTYEELYGIEKTKDIKKKHSETFKYRMKKGIVKGFRGRKGPKNHNWKGGVSFGEYSYEFNKALKEAIKIRDNYKCKICGIHDKDTKQGLCIHHINYNKQNNQPENLISLCHKCHSKTNGHRHRWVKYFSREFVVQKEFVSWYEIHNLCKQIAEYLKMKNVSGIIPILRGGAIPAVIVSSMLNIPVKYQRTSKYDVFIDEIVDYGLTIKSIKSKYPNNLFVCLDLNTAHFKQKIKPDCYIRKVNKYIVYPWEIE